MAPVLVAGIFVSAVLWVLVFHRYLFAPFVAVELWREESMQRVLDRAEDLLRGRRLDVLPSAAVPLLIAASRALTPWGVGLVVTVPVGVCGVTSLFRQISPKVTLRSPPALRHYSSQPHERSELERGACALARSSGLAARLPYSVAIPLSTS